MILDIYEQAYIEACELDSPNSPDFEALVDRIEERLWNEHLASKLPA